MVFNTNLNERMRLDQNGNLLVGTTGAVLPESANASGEAGVSLDASNYVSTARYQNISGYFNRIGNDGDIVQFRKDGSTVGSIGSRLGANIVITAPTATYFDGGIRPLTDNTEDIGVSSLRFKDLYLSGSIHGDVKFENNAGTTEYARFDNSGNLLLGKTAESFGTQGVAFRRSPSTGASGSIFTRDGDNVAAFNRLTSDGKILSFNKDGSTVGNIGVYAGDYLTIGEGGSAGVVFHSTSIRPWNLTTNTANDDAIDLGSSSARFDDIYATNGTIQTSDQTEKQDIAALTSTEMLVGKRISALFKTFRWKDKVVEKGDNARTHTGIIAQDVQAAFTAEGLDAGDYSLFISSTWLVDSEGNEVEEGTEGAVSKTKMGIRYPELLSFVAAYNEQRFANIETRLTALEG
jgi:hypothetical protein